MASSNYQIEEIFEGVFKINGFLATKNFVRATRVYDEKIFLINSVEYREWNFFKSKLAAAIKKGLKNFPFKSNSQVLYLGASSGTTVSHISDICYRGTIIAVEFSQRPMRQLLNLAKIRPNIIPIFADANQPNTYFESNEEFQADIIYQDVAQPNQDEILIKNAQLYLKKGSHAFLCIKSQSIDVVLKPIEVYKKVIQNLEKNGFKTIQKIELEPYDKDHLFWHGIYL
ncbi:MAG: fibrillarin-like rRNA/tRNA 2'-O-methyltransferase [Candidatus Micrarchaeota archaeon]|nr:fibrillarin-like rRNA/tRNA 2'-O-methyltransferase [Candidatus Micrarchaeota archaeon]